MTYIAAITRGHNSSLCLLENGKIVLSLEEERLSRHKYDGGPLSLIYKILDFTDKIDYLVIAHTQSLTDTGPKIDFTGDDIYTGLCRKLGLIDRNQNIYNHPQVIDMSMHHHKLHAACAFYRSGFDSATAVIVDGAGTFIPMTINGESIITWELESIFNCNYPNEFKTVWKHQGCNGPIMSGKINEVPSDFFNENGYHELVLDDSAGITKTYEAATQYCGWPAIEAGKTMGLFPYGEENNKIPEIFTDTVDEIWSTSNRNLIIPTYPNGALINSGRYDYLNYYDSEDITLLQNRRDIAYAVQIQSQKQVLNLILESVKKTGIKQVVLSGGYALNCVANYSYLSKLNDYDIELYVEPISNDAGTSIGAALLQYHLMSHSNEKINYPPEIYLGFNYDLNKELDELSNYDIDILDANNSQIIDLIIEGHIVSLYQGRSENGPRALGNRSILFDPRHPDGKNIVNSVKHREYFRPFAGTVLLDHVHDWFDMKGLEESPFMMYAVKCRDDKKDLIPAIIHVDGTCRIQTLKKDDNKNFYNLITEFYNRTNFPILFNTSFNLGGEPLVETLQDAIRTLENSLIEYLYLPEIQKLIYIKNV